MKRKAKTQKDEGYICKKCKTLYTGEVCPKCRTLKPLRFREIFSAVDFLYAILGGFVGWSFAGIFGFIFGALGGLVASKNIREVKK